MSYYLNIQNIGGKDILNVTFYGLAIFVAFQIYAISIIPPRPSPFSFSHIYPPYYPFLSFQAGCPMDGLGT